MNRADFDLELATTIDVGKALLLDGSMSMDGNVGMNNKKITNLST